MGRSHSVALAASGVDMVLCDACADMPSVQYPLASRADLEETARLVADQGRQAVALTVDVRDRAGLDQAVGTAMERFGHLDILLANAGVSASTPILGGDPEVWDEVVATNLTGVYNSIRAAAPAMVTGRWGRVVVTASMLGRSSAPTQAAYVASKWGVIGLVKAAAQDLAAHGITVNAVAPGNVNTPMIHNDALFRTVRPDLDQPTAEDAAAVLRTLHLQPVPWIEASEVTDAVMYLLGAEHVTGSVLDVNAGASAHFTA
jgi:NAD(P)-dependent dehydrogenase (short-subunit alcohol dehydrogenase family)